MDIETKEHDDAVKVAQEAINQFNITSQNIRIIIAKRCLMGFDRWCWYSFGKVDYMLNKQYSFFTNSFPNGFPVGIVLTKRIKNIISKDILEKYDLHFIISDNTFMMRISRK